VSACAQMDLVLGYAEPVGEPSAHSSSRAPAHADRVAGKDRDFTTGVEAQFHALIEDAGIVDIVDDAAGRGYLPAAPLRGRAARHNHPNPPAPGTWASAAGVIFRCRKSIQCAFHREKASGRIRFFLRSSAGSMRISCARLADQALHEVDGLGGGPATAIGKRSAQYW